MLKTLLTTLLFLLAFNIYSAPVVYDPLYKIELLTTVTGSALHAMDISSNGRLFVSSYNDGKVFVLDSPAASGAQTAIEYASGFVNANGLAFADDGRLFASTSFGSIYQVFNNGTSSLFSSGHANSTSLASYNNDLYISNSGDGTISQVDGITSTVSTVVSGLSSPNGSYGLSMDNSGMMYFTDHATGEIFSSDLVGNLSSLGLLTPFGVGYTGMSNSGDLFVSDILTKETYKIDGEGNMSLFASGFAGKINPPFNGPHDYAFDNNGNIYISDASSIWRISAVPVPTALWLFGSGLLGLIGVARRKG